MAEWGELYRREGAQLAPSILPPQSETGLFLSGTQLLLGIAVSVVILVFISYKKGRNLGTPSGPIQHLLFFVNQAIRVATKNGINFAVSVFCVMLFFLYGWSVIAHLVDIRYGIPYPPCVAIPLLGNACNWPLGQSVLGISLLTIIAIGVVTISARSDNSQKE